MTAFIAKLVIKSEMREQFEKAQTELRELTYLNEPETPVYELLKSRDNPEVYFCVATFMMKPHLIIICPQTFMTG